MSKARKWLLAFGVFAALDAIGIFLRMADGRIQLDGTEKLALNFLLVVCPVGLIMAAFRKEE